MAGLWLLGTGFWSLVTGHSLLVTGHWLLGTGLWSLVTGHLLLVTGHWLLVTRYLSLVTRYLLLVTGHWLLDTGYSMLDISWYTAQGKGLKLGVFLIKIRNHKSQIRIQKHLPIETRKQVLILRNNVDYRLGFAEIGLPFINH